MNKRPTHRYKIWQLAEGDLAGHEPASPRQVEDLVALMALYDYRPLIETELRGTCTFSNGGSSNCKTTMISSEAVHLVYDAQTADPAAKRPNEIRAGSAVQLDLDQIGAFRGVVASKKPEGFRVAVDDDCKPMLRTKLARIAAEHAISLDDGSVVDKSSIKRIEPEIKSCSYLDHTGTLRQGVIVNLSQVDALIKARIVPPVNSRIIFRGSRRHQAEVTRTFEMGFAARFSNLISAEGLSDALKFSD
ncbi:hypothetical protein [Methylovirgula sp. HY1]|uniref:hypothetical protein n=1 Tax=Methylovirgula sp. HY1 TaxID=2822761 RepID=UPI001C5A6E71|nr:hypothetical protein [Methylovirgula sp. HY1]QXX75891.1 hypothetical protein MHY1_02724 [Methylovirgula sp. HY1]